MIEDRYRYATPRGIAALAGISESKAHAALILFKQRGRWIDLRDPAVRIYLERQQTRRIESATFGAIFELCYPVGIADARMIESALNLPVLEAVAGRVGSNSPSDCPPPPVAACPRS